MSNNAHDDFVSYELAVKLKELGFDWECQAYFEDYLDELNRHHRKFRFNAVTNDMLHKDFCAAPTRAQAQKWLREVKGIDLVVFPSYTQGEKKYHHAMHRFYPSLNYVDYVHYNTYEDALSACIDDTIELLIEEGK